MVTTERSYFFGTGRRKEAVARVRLHPGATEIIVNGKPISVYFPRIVSQMVATEPLRTAGVEGHFGVTVKVLGGGCSGQAGAVSLGVARALLQSNPELRSPLRQAGLLTRDARVKERKKYGLKRARKAPQYTKR
jgi:small subunit ribosomal protein S9